MVGYKKGGDFMAIGDTEKLTPEDVEKLQTKIRHLRNVGVQTGGPAGEQVNKMRNEQAKGVTDVLRGKQKPGE